MLSISNISAIQGATYYQKDNYYAREDGEGDIWQGKLREELELPAHVNPDDFNKLLKEQSPERAGFDLCFSAPKSVSIAAMLLSEQTQEDMKYAHNAAVQATLDLIEKREVGTRITKNGVTEHVKTGNMICGKFNHYVSRNSDPQLHTHAVVLNKTQHEGKFYAIDNTNIYKNKILYGQLYRNELAKQLMQKGYEVMTTDPVQGFFELKGIDPIILEQFSTRRAEILEKLREWDNYSVEASAKATLLTRKAKEHKDINALKESWKETLKDGGVSEIILQKADTPIIPTAEEQEKEFTEAVNYLEKRSFAFTDQNLKRAILAAGVVVGMNEEECEALLQADSKGKSILVDLGSPINTEDNKQYYTTKKNLDIEKEIFAEVSRTKNTLKNMKSEDIQKVLDQALKRDDTQLSTQQREAVTHIARTKDQYTAVQGLAGTGKTHMLNYAREVLESAGYEVAGAAYTGKAAQGLEEDGHITSGTIHALLNRLEREAGNFKPSEDMQIKTEWNLSGLKPGTKPEAWIVDEASLVDNATLRYVMEAAKLKHAKVILVGDRQQLHPIGVGNAFTTLTESKKIGTVVLTEIRRQKNHELLQIVKEAVAGDVNKSLELLAKDTQIIEKNTARIKAITKDFTALSTEEQKKTVILTAANKDRVAINKSIRSELVKQGKLDQGTTFTTQDATGKNHKREFAVDDKVIFLQNDNKLGLKNGQTAYITKIDGNLITFTSGEKESDKKELVVDMEKYNKIDHGYVMTAHKAQGITVDRAFVHLDSTQQHLNSRNAFYVDVSRARHEVKIYVDDLGKINGQIQEFTKKITSEDFLISAAKEGVEKPTKTFKQRLGVVVEKIKGISNNEIKSIQHKKSMNFKIN